MKSPDESDLSDHLSLEWQVDAPRERHRKRKNGKPGQAFPQGRKLARSDSENSRTSVVHVIDSGGYGGGERYILDVASNASRGFRHAVAIPCEGPLERMLAAKCVPFALIDMQHLFLLKTVLRLRRLLLGFKAEIVHTHGYRANLYGRLAALLAGKKNVCTVHVSLFDYLDTPAALRLSYMAAEAATGWSCDRFICISNAMAKDTLRLGVGRNRIVSIPNGVDLERFSVKKSSSRVPAWFSGVSGDGPVIGTVGRAVVEKGQGILVRAMVRLVKLFPGIKCIFIGEGPLKNDLEQMAVSLGVRENCIFPGVFDEIERVYPLMDLFVLPSIREPFGLVVLEAMATGTPVVATAAGGPADFLRSGANGMLVPPKNSDALAEAIADLLSDPAKRKRIAAAGYRTAHQRFGIEKTVAEIERVYLSILERRN